MVCRRPVPEPGERGEAGRIPGRCVSRLILELTDPGRRCLGGLAGDIMAKAPGLGNKARSASFKIEDDKPVIVPSVAMNAAT